MVPYKYSHLYVPLKYHFSSYRALSDGRSGIKQLEKQVNNAKIMLEEWKVIWIGTCTILRSSIELFRIDARSCLNKDIIQEIKLEWNNIKKNPNEHQIFWQFLKKERDNIVHEYEWQAYETWMHADGTFRPSHLALSVFEDDGARPLLLMRSGPFAGRNSLELLTEGAAWVEARLFGAIMRAGYDPEEARNVVDFSLPQRSDGLLTALGGGDISSL